jgi:hypothetical protein
MAEINRKYPSSHPRNIKRKSYKRKQWRPPIKTKKEEKPEPEEPEGMPHHQHYPHAKRRGDTNPKYHEEQHKDIA